MKRITAHTCTHIHNITLSIYYYYFYIYTIIVIHVMIKPNILIASPNYGMYEIRRLASCCVFDVWANIILQCVSEPAWI